jgi:hypothetical protein
MKKFTKLTCLLIALLMVVACFASCGGSGEDTTLPTASGITDNDTGRNAVKDTVPTDLKFNGEKMTFFVRDDNDLWKNEIDVEKTTNNTLFDAIYYRNAAVEQRLGIDIEQIGQSGNFSASDAWNSTLRNSVLTKSGDYEAAAIYASTGSALAVEGLYYNVLDLPHLNLDQPWWNQTIKNELTLFDTLYYLGGDIVVTEIANGMTMFFNKDLFTELYQTQNIDLYAMVDEQKWTIDKLHEFVAGAWIDENSDGVISDGDTVGYKNNATTGSDGGMDAWIPAMGIRLTTIIDGYPELTFYDEHTVEAFEKVKDFHLNNPGSLVSASAPATSFNIGNQLFTRSNLNAGDKFRDMQDDYGVLPLPKFDEEQDDYYTTFDNTSSLIVVLSTCTATEKVGATLELMAAEAYKQVTPAYFEICLQGKYSDEPQDAAMYDRILKTFVFNFGFCYSTKSLDGMGSLFRNLTSDIAQTYEANKTKYQTALETLIDKRDEISFLM